MRPLSWIVSLALCGAFPSAPLAAEWPQWPLQHQPGPDGDPKQDRASFPKSSVPPQKPQKRITEAKPALTDAGNGDLVLTGGWKLQEARKVAGTARELSAAGFDASAWLDATVPGTVLTTLVDQGVYPEPTYGLNNMAIPESLNREDYWYRTEFTPSRDLAGRTLTLTLNGVNYAGDVWLNGARLGEIRGAFLRGTFDVSSRVRAGEPNALVVRISPVPHPGIPHEESLTAGAGPNGGAMLFDGPTFFCTEGWDWIPGIRDRVAGIWQDVVLHVGGPVRIGDVQVVTDLPLPDTTTADVTVKAALENRSAEAQKTVLRGEFEGVTFEKPVSLAPGERTVVVFSPADSARLRVRNPRLWWPNGYGKPELYHLKLSALDAGGHASDVKAERFGIREVAYELSALDARAEVRRFELSPTSAPGQWVIDKRHAALRETPLAWVPTFAEGGESSPAVRFLDDTTTAPFLVIKVNGRRVVCKGGNWGLDDAMKRVSRERLEPYFRMERDANLTMIRNWCGQNTEKVFFDLADEYGLMVWNDFWTSTQNWNLQPGDLDLWLANAADTIKRFRNHPSIVIWCGRNEGVPPPYLNEGLDALVREHDGTRYYQPNSNKLNLNDSGPWVWADPVNFFTRYGKGFTTELGLPSAPTADAVRAMMPEADWWPISDSLGLPRLAPGGSRRGAGLHDRAGHAVRRGRLARRLQPQGADAELRRPPGDVRRPERQPLEARLGTPHVDESPGVAEHGVAALHLRLRRPRLLLRREEGLRARPRAAEPPRPQGRGVEHHAGSDPGRDGLRGDLRRVRQATRAPERGARRHRQRHDAGLHARRGARGRPAALLRPPPARLTGGPSAFRQLLLAGRARGGPQGAQRPAQGRAHGHGPAHERRRRLARRDPGAEPVEVPCADGQAHAAHLRRPAGPPGVRDGRLLLARARRRAGRSRSRRRTPPAPCR